MIGLLMRVMKLLLGLMLYALGIVVTIKANIGYGPWEVFHVGLGKTLNISIGNASIIVGFVIIMITLILGEKIGLGTISNMILIGVFIDIIYKLNIIPLINNFYISILFLILGLYIISVGSYFYIGSGFGAGPRDSLMVLLTRKTKLPIGVVRASIEICATLSGWLLGGMVGIGTLIAGFAIGVCIQSTFLAFKFDPTKIKHATLTDSYRELKAIINNKKYPT